MDSQKISRYPHRLNRDGSCESICTVCLATIASVANEADLAHHEDEHVCSQARLNDLCKYPPTAY
jgi:hypothetical protein